MLYINDTNAHVQLKGIIIVTSFSYYTNSFYQNSIDFNDIKKDFRSQFEANVD